MPTFRKGSFQKLWMRGRAQPQAGTSTNCTAFELVRCLVASLLAELDIFRLRPPQSIATAPRLLDQKATVSQSREFLCCMFVDQFLTNSGQPERCLYLRRSGAEARARSYPPRQTGITSSLLAIATQSLLIAERPPKIGLAPYPPSNLRIDAAGLEGLGDCQAVGFGLARAPERNRDK